MTSLVTINNNMVEGFKGNKKEEKEGLALEKKKSLKQIVMNVKRIQIVQRVNVKIINV